MQESNRGTLFSGRELLVLVLLALPLLVTTSAIEAADWVKGMPSLKALAVISLFLWALLARSRLSGLIVHPLALLVGLGTAFLLGAWTIEENSGFGDLGGQLSHWFNAIGSIDGDEGEAFTGIGLLAMTIWMAHVTVWLAYRRRTSLFAILPGLIVLLVVLAFLPSNYYWYFLVFPLAAAPGLVYRREGRWTVPGARPPLATSMVTGVALIGLTMLLVWRAPAPNESVIPLVDQFEDSIYSLEENWSVLFQGVPNRKKTLSFSLPLDLPIGEPIELGEQVLMEVESADPYRWRMRVYETYTKFGWLSEQLPVVTDTKQAALQVPIAPLLAREEVEINVKIHSKSNTLLSVGEPISASMTTNVLLSPEPIFDLNLDGGQWSYIPTELQAFSNGLGLWGSSRGAINPGRVLDGGSWEVSPGGQVPGGLLDSLSIAGIPVIELSDQDDRSFELIPTNDAPHLLVRRSDPPAGPPLALTGTRTLVPPRQYTTVGSISVATPEMLRSAGIDYPTSITDRYLQLPVDFPNSVKDLAQQLTGFSTGPSLTVFSFLNGEESIASTTIPYDAAEAIRRHLISLPYSTDVSLPAPGRDWVEHFLLVERRGFCNNFASAMITMLRSLGIPARLVVGMAPGIASDDGGTFEVRTKNYHSWPEVYFPSYGWVEFEPTPSGVQDSLVQLGIDEGGGVSVGRPARDDCLQDFSAAECAFLGQQVNISAEDVPDRGGSTNSNFTPDEPSSPGGGGSIPSQWIFLGVLLGFAVVVPTGVGYHLWRSATKAGYVTYTYTLMCLLGRLGGIRLQPQETPREYSSRLTAALPDQAEQIRCVTDRFVSFRYGGLHRSMYSQEMWSLRAAWPVVRRGLLKLIIRRLRPRRA